MAASSAHRTTGPCRMLASALLLAISLLNAGVLAQEEEVVPETKAPSVLMPNVRGDMIPRTTAASEPEDPQLVVFPTVGPLGPQQEGDDKDSDEGAEAKATTAAAPTDAPIVVAADTPSPVPSRGDGPNNIPQVQIYEVVCVGKEAVQDKNAVSLKLKTASSCEETKAKIESVLPELCGADCRLEIFQEDDSNEMIVSGKDVEDDVSGMATKFNNDNVKDKTDVEEAVPRWGKSSKLVLVSLLLTGLLLAVLLVAGYYLKTHRKNSKGVRLAESFQVDEENQANTLVSVAPLPQEPLDKPTENGESPPENGTNASPTTNGHSATQVPVADTEM